MQAVEDLMVEVDEEMVAAMLTSRMCFPVNVDEAEYAVGATSLGWQEVYGWKP